MSSLAQADIFFFISSTGFVILAILAIIILVLCIRAVTVFNRILVKIEDSMENIGDATMELLDDMRDSLIFRMFFRPSKGRKSQQRVSSKVKIEK